MAFSDTDFGGFMIFHFPGHHKDRLSSIAVKRCPIRGTVFFLVLVAVLLAAGSIRADVGTAVRLSTDIVRGDTPLAVRFDVLARTVPSDAIARVEIDPGDGGATILAHTGKGWIRANPRYTYDRPGRFDATLILTTTDGQRVTAQTRITVLPETTADPGELLKVRNAVGDSPLEAGFRIGGDSLPFTATSMRLAFGDGHFKQVLPFETLTHVYEKPGRYLARLGVMGKDGNRARAARQIVVAEGARLRFTVAPIRGLAPMEVTVRANIPKGDIRRAGVLQDGKEIAATPALVGQAEFRRKITLAEPGNYRFELRAITENGTPLNEVRDVEVRIADVAQDDTYYEHAGGVVQIVQQGGAFEGTLRAPSRAQALAGYDAGEVIVRGAFADRASSGLRPRDYDDPDAPRRRFYREQAAQTAGGSYLLRVQNCPEQWTDYYFRINFNDLGTADDISGRAIYKAYETRVDRAYRRADMPKPRAGMIGKLIWLAEVLDVMASTGDTSQNPDECVLADDPSQTMPAVFTRISRDRALELAGENMNDLRDFAERAYDSRDQGPPDDGTPRIVDATYGDPPSSQDPVYLASGEYYETRVDLRALSAQGDGWRFQRTYRSQSPVHTSLGHGWVHNYQLALVKESDGWRFRDQNGGYERFSPIGKGLFGAADGSRLLVEGSGRVIRFPDGSLYRFSPTALRQEQSRLERIISAGGTVLRFEYDLADRLVAVIDEQGRVARYVYDGDRGYLRRVVAPDGRAVSFSHDRDGNLVSVFDVASPGQSPRNETRYSYRGGGESVAPDLRHNLVQVWLSAGTDRRAALEMTYGEDPGSLGFDRVVSQRTVNLIENFAYSWSETADGRWFTTTLSAQGRADEIHRFSAGGLYQGVTHVLADGRRVTTRKLYDENGLPAGTILDSGAGTRISAGPDQDLTIYSTIPASGSGLAPIHWVVEREPVFGQQKALFGPFVGDIPDSREAIGAAPVFTRVFDYEESGAAALPGLDRFGIKFTGAALGDVNGDGIVNQGFGNVVRETTYGAGSDTVRIRWAGNGLPLERARQNGEIRRFEYTENGFLSGVFDRLGNGAVIEVARYDWDENGRLVGFGTGEDYVGMERDRQGRIARILNREGVERGYSHDAFGRVTGETRNGERIAQYIYDPFGRLLERRRWADAGSEITETFVHDASGRVISATDPSGTWSRKIDALGRTSLEILPDGAQKSFAYGPDGLLRSVTGPGWSRDYTYDGFARLIEIDNGGGNLVRFTYDAAGKPLLRQAISDGAVILETTFPVTGKDARVARMGAGKDRMDVSPAPQASRLGVAPRRAGVAAVQRDWLGRPVEFAMRDQSVWRATWDGSSRLVRMSRDGVTLFDAQFAPGGTLASVRFFGFAPVRFEFDGLRETRRDGRGAVTVLQRDGRGRIAGETAEFNGEVSTRAFTYDVANRMIAHRRDGISWRRTYRGLAPVSDALTFPGGEEFEISRAYDPRGRLSARVLPSGARVAFSYPDERSSLIEVAGKRIRVAYAIDGAIASLSLGRARVAYTHPVLGIGETGFAVTVQSADTTVLDRRLSMIQGRVMSIQEPLIGEGGRFEHDAGGRLLSASHPYGDGGAAPTFATEVFRYSPDRARLPATGDTPWLPTHAEGARLADLDPDGRVRRLNGRQFDRDPFGLLARVTSKGGATGIVRDAQGRVVAFDQTEGRVFIVHDGGTVVGVYPPGAAPVEYILDATGVPVARLSEGVLELIALDFGGGPVAYVDEQGAITQRLLSSAFGVPLIWEDGRFFAPRTPMPLLDGMLYAPSTGLYLTPGRAMDPETGQFLAIEPLGPTASVDPYAYGFGDPFSYRDPTGAQGTGLSPSPDPEGIKGPRDALEKAFEAAADNIEENVANGMGGEGRQDGGKRRSNGSGSGTGRNSGGSDGYGGGGYGGGGGFAMPGMNDDPERDERLAQSARSAARRREKVASFKRNTRYGAQILPENLVRRWLNPSATGAGFGMISRENALIGAGAVQPGVLEPLLAVPDDPHRLLRMVLKGDNRVGGRTGDRLRYIFRDQLAVPLPVTPPAGQRRGAFAPGASARDNRVSLSGGGATPTTDTPQPTPARPRKPGGLSGIGGF